MDPAGPFRGADALGHDAQVVVFCDHGWQSSLATATLQDMGFSRATDLDGGFAAWREAGLPVEASDGESSPHA